MIPCSRSGNGLPRRRRNVGVILAGGVGSRMGLDIPKQFVPVAGRTSLEHSVAVFQGCDCFNEILVMIEPDSIARARELLPLQQFNKIIGITADGADRSETSYLALRRIRDPEANLIFHDAVRPLVDTEIIRSCIDALDIYPAVDTAIPSSDTIIEVDEQNFIRSVPPRAKLRRGQTPQAFRLSVISAAYGLVRKKLGLDLFVTGGTLLGPVWDGHIMPGDDDADLAYMSSSENPSDIALESYRLERMLASEGYETVRHSAGHLQLIFPGNAVNDRFYIDIFTYFTLGGWFYGPFHAMEPARDVTVFPLQSLNVNGQELPGPAKPEQMLAAIYGPGWRTPDPAFRFNTPAPAWRRFHGWLSSYDADLGCGVGVDARHLADQGHHVLAVDYSRPALHAAGGSPHRRLVLRRTNLASTREAVALAGAIPVTGTPLHVYARLLLNALDPSGQDCTLTLIRHVLRVHGSGRAFLEIDPGPIPGLYAGWSNYRPVDPARLGQELHDEGLEIEDSADYFGAEDGCHHLQLRVKARTP